MMSFAAIVLAAAAASTPPSCFTMHDEAKMVFFESGSADFRKYTPDVLGEAVRIGREEHYLREIVTGYCDTDESAAGMCPALAQHRAQAVKAALVKLGMKAKRIEVFTRTDPLNPDDPRENRRVVIEPILPPDGCPGP
jgi:outer membrane protein OmpA-like peptidoglycan-associated protein